VTRNSVADDAAVRARRAATTGSTPVLQARGPEVVQQELANLDRTLTKKSLNPAIRADLLDAKRQKTTELKQVLQQTITNLETNARQVPGDVAASLRERAAGYRAQLTALQGPPPVDLNAAKVKVDQAMQTGGPKAAMGELERQAMSMGQPDAARLLDACGPTIDQVASDQMKGDSADREQALTSLAHAAKIAGPEATKQVGARLAAAVTETATRGSANGHVGGLDNGFKAAIAAGAGADLAVATRAALDAAGKHSSAGKVGAATLDALKQPAEVYGKARDAYAQCDAQLSQHLAELGNGLTPEQRQKFTDAYWADPKNKAIKDAYGSSESALADSVKRDGPALEQAALAGDTKAGELLMKDMAALATTPNCAKQALDFVQRVGDPANKALFDALNTDGKLEQRLSDDVLAPAIGSAQSQAMLTGSMDGLVDQLKAIRSQGKNFKKLPDQLKGALESFDTIKTMLAAGKSGQDIMSTLRFDRLTEGWDKKSKLGKAMAVFTVVSSAVKAGQTTDGLEKLGASLSSVKGGLELTAGVLGTLGRAGKLAGGEAAGKLISKYLPFVGMAVDGVQLAEDLRTLGHGGNAGDAIATAGTVISLVGDVAAVVPVLGTAVDGVVGTIGSIVQGIGGLVSDAINGEDQRKQREADRDRYLTAAGVPPETRAVLERGSFTDLSALSTMGLSTDQFLGALRAQQSLPNNDQGKSAMAMQTSWELAAAYGLKGQDALRFVDQMRQKITGMSWEDLDRVQRSASDVAGVTIGATHDGDSPEQVRQAVSDRLDQLDFILQQTAGDVFNQWGLGAKGPGDLNQAFFTTWDQR
jgi:hypothetical protein